jgi:hypothetical protein
MVEGVDFQLRAQLAGEADVACIVEPGLTKDEYCVGVLQLDQLTS